jgi:hypothetical protein
VFAVALVAVVLWSIFGPVRKRHGAA